MIAGFFTPKSNWRNSSPLYRLTPSTAGRRILLESISFCYHALATSNTLTLEGLTLAFKIIVIDVLILGGVLEHSQQIGDWTSVCVDI